MTESKMLGDTPVEIVHAGENASDGLPPIDAVRALRVSLPDEARERADFLCKVCDPARDVMLRVLANRCKIAEEWFAERLEDTRRQVERAVKAGVVARITGKTARSLGLISDEEAGELIYSILET